MKRRPYQKSERHSLSLLCEGNHTIDDVMNQTVKLERLIRAQTPPDWFRTWHTRQLAIMHGVPFSEKKPDNKTTLTEKDRLANILTGSNPPHFKLSLISEGVHKFARWILKHIRHDFPV